MAQKLPRFAQVRPAGMVAEEAGCEPA